MKKLLFLLLILANGLTCVAQNWTEVQLSAANTAKNITYLSNIEKEAILYINLARLYPKEFAKKEVENYYGTAKYGEYLKDSKWRSSLITELNSREAISALTFEEKLYEDAKCFSKEMGDKGQIGHERKTCQKSNYAECCSYGMNTGKDIAMQLLIDHEVESLGHRKICLDSSYSRIGISVASHKQWETCAVAEIIW